MPKIARVSENGEVEESIEVSSDEDLVDTGEKLGVAFGCIDGRCGSCRVEIVEGAENLSELTKNELDMGMNDDEPFRLLCQCRIKKQGLIKIRV